MKTRRTCVQIRRSIRNTQPYIHKTQQFIEKHVVRSSVVGFVPTVVNDAFVHHIHVTPNEILRVAVDEISVSSMTALAIALLGTSKDIYYLLRIQNEKQEK